MKVSKRRWLIVEKYREIEAVEQIQRSLFGFTWWSELGRYSWGNSSIKKEDVLIWIDGIEAELKTKQQFKETVTILE